MSNNNNLVSKFLDSYGNLATKTNDLVALTCLLIWKQIFEALKVGYFERDDVELVKRVDKKLKKTLGEELKGYCDSQASLKPVIKSLEKLPEHLWNESGNANCGVFTAGYVASTSSYTLKPATYMRVVRAALTWKASTDGRMTIWNMLQLPQEQMLEAWTELRAAYDARNDDKPKDKSDGDDKSDSGGDDTSPDDDGGESVQLEAGIVADAYKDLGHALAAVELSKAQQGAICRMIKEVTEKVTSLNTAPTVELPKPEKMAASK